ncbi:hypothetical protein BABINDRAFT_125426 [Babjeviella inositovora NRRL Y-12698]|uniref:ESCRT-II complex subunit VPS25 n=1 Tax=Babjeviella inositovora NRRL Y-12698 TaxID=984486 RepID=A0A1E3QUJ3_9ASCO|nr:uncharacterized protein BABINDRAFT_125426 [Babjeviella inositovora NRRL Y-12698]ODQ80617.1 hypothetical protein BABINDRAFT_125426 [Babjeviella inositovora NRRL Y-12698]
MTDADFKFPPIYNFPPFYTKQPNETTWQSQSQQWIGLVLDYCKQKRIWVLNSDGVPLSKNDSELDSDEEVDSLSLFANEKIQRSLKRETIGEIYAQMVTEGSAEYLSPVSTSLSRSLKKATPQDQSIIVYWRKPEDWATMLLEWVEKTGQLGGILTLYELQASESVKSQPFYKINSTVLVRALDVLVKMGRAQVLKEEGGKISGVKIV